MARVKKEHKWGFINTKGEKVIEYKFDDACNFSKGLAEVQINNKTYKVNINGDFIVLDENKNRIEISRDFDCVSNFKEHLALAVKYDKYGFVNIEGKEIIECKFDEANDFNEGLASVKRDGKWGFINIRGEQVIECKFDDVGRFSEGLARVKKDRKWGFINTRGEQVIEYKFDNAWSFSEGLAYVEIGGAYGYINTSGEVIIEYKSFFPS